MPAKLVITNAGRAALLNAQQDGTRAVRVTRCGVSATALVATPTTAALPGEIKRIATVSGGAAGADVIHLIVLDESAATFTLRSFALYLEDGTLFAAYGQAEPILEKSAQALMLLQADVKLADIDAVQIEFTSSAFVNPPATTETRGVVELATHAEAEAGTDSSRALTPANIGAILSAARILQRLVTVDGSGSGLDADLLDGLHASAFARLSGSTFVGPVDLVGSDLPALAFRKTGVASWFVGGDGTAAARFVIRQGGPPALAIDGSNDTVLGGSLKLSATLLPRILPKLTFEKDITRWTLGGDDTETTSFRLKLYDTTVAEANSNFIFNISSGLLQVGGQTAWHAGNDGSGSGLDADLLDGQQGSWYADVTARLGYQPVRQMGAAVAEIGFAGGRLRARVNGDTDLGAIVFDDQIANVWRSSNDGSGSGLDADMVDGWQAIDLRRWANLVDRPESFPASAHTHGAADIAGAFATRLFAADGYQQLPGGLIVQWMAGAADPARSEGTQSILFPISFPNACLRAFPATRIPSGTTAADSFYQILGDPGPSSVTVQRQLTGSPDNNVSTIPLIFAIGF